MDRGRHRDETETGKTALGRGKRDNRPGEERREGAWQDRGFGKPSAAQPSPAF